VSAPAFAVLHEKKASIAVHGSTRASDPGSVKPNKYNVIHLTKGENLPKEKQLPAKFGV
jgi:hypothetical protein